MSNQKALKIAQLIDAMTYREFIDFVDDISSWVDGNTAKDPKVKWCSAVSAWAETRKEE